MALGLALFATGCGSSAESEPGHASPDLSTIGEAIGEAACATATPFYTVTVTGPGLWGTESSTWQSAQGCHGMIAQFNGLTNKRYAHYVGFDSTSYPTNESNCINSYVWAQGLDVTCGIGCTGFVNDPNDANYDSPTLYQGTWNGSSCVFALASGYQPLPWHTTNTYQNYRARTVSAALFWNGSGWEIKKSYSGLFSWD